MAGMVEKKLAELGIALPTPNPTITVKATLPQTFMELVAKQVQRLEPS